MFASSNPFGQQSGSPFGSSSVFGQTSEQNRNSFVPKPFGSTTPFGSSTGGSIFGGNSTGVFGASTSPFGAAAPSPAFGSSNPAFGASSTPPFGSSSSSFGGSSVFGQIGGFGSSPSQTNSFSVTSQPTQPTFGGSTFVSSSPFGASSQPASAVTSTAALGITSTPAFGSRGTAFGVSNAPAFGSGGAFGASSTPSFGAASTQGFSFGYTQTFGQSTSAAGSGSLFATGPSSFSNQTSPVVSTGFGQSALSGQRRGSRVAAYTSTAEDGGDTQSAGRLVSVSAMPAYREKSHEELRCEDYQSGDKGGRNPLGQPAAATTQTNPFGPPSTTGNLFSSSTTSNPFAPKPDGVNGFSASSTLPFSSSTTSNPFAPKPDGVNGFNASSTLSNPFSPPATSNPFGPTKTGVIGFNASSTQSSLFSRSTTSNPFGPTKTGVIGFNSSTTASNPFNPSPSSSQQAVNIASFSTTPNPFSHQSPAFNSTGSGVSSTSKFNLAPNSSPSPFATISSPAFPSSLSIFRPTSAPEPAQVFKPDLSLPNNQSFPTFLSPSSLWQTNASLRQSPSLFGPSSAPSFSQPNMFSSTSSLLPTSNPAGFCQTPSLSTPSQPAQTAHPVAGFYNTKGKSSAEATIGQSSFNQAFTTQPSFVTSPFGTLPTVPQMSIGQLGSAPSVQYGISSMPVSDKPTSVGISSFLTSRHLSQKRFRVQTRKYDPKSGGPKVPFFRDDEETPRTNNADALFMPRENPRSLVIRSTGQWPTVANIEQISSRFYASVHVNKNGNVFAEVSAPAVDGSIHQNKDENSGENGTDKGTSNSVQPNIKPSWVQDSYSTPKEEFHFTVTEYADGEAATEHEHGFDGKALIPKLKHSDYYTEPPIHELAAKERDEPGFCSRVKDFVIGRHGYGKIEFLGETDVQRLDLNSLVQFNNREVIVYMDESKKPPVGHGLNKPAEVTLLNIMCIDKKTGKKFTDGLQVDRYRDMLIKKTKDQGAEFLLYNPVEGEWKFRVQHFSQYEFKDENTCT